MISIQINSCLQLGKLKIFSKIKFAAHFCCNSSSKIAFSKFLELINWIFQHLTLTRFSVSFTWSIWMWSRIWPKVSKNYFVKHLTFMTIWKIRYNSPSDCLWTSLTVKSWSPNFHGRFHFFCLLPYRIRY